MTEKLLNITYEGLAQSHKLYASDSSLRSELRFGQYIWNKFGMKDKSWSRLFYEYDDGVAYDMAFAQCGLVQESKQGPDQQKE